MKIKVLHIVFSLDPGGLENGLVNVASRLPEDLFQVDVCCLERKGAFAERLPDHSRILVLGKKPGISLTAVAKLSAYIFLTRPDVVHTHNLGPLIYGVWATLGGRLAPVLHGEHGQIISEEMVPNRLAQRAKYYRRCAALHTVSRSLTSHIEDTFGIHSVQTVVNGVDSVRFRPGAQAEAKSALGLPTDALVVGVVGRFVNFKRQLEVFEAFQKIAEDIPTLALLMVGDGPMMPAVRQAVDASSFADRVSMPGFMENPEDAYHAMDVLLMPSLIEGLSNVLLEAMACGIPPIAHTACGSGDVIIHGENGLLLDLSGNDDLVDALMSVAGGEHEFGTMGLAARRAAETIYSLDTMASGYAELYERVARRKTWTS